MIFFKDYDTNAQSFASICALNWYFNCVTSGNETYEHKMEVGCVILQWGEIISAGVFLELATHPVRK